MLPSYPVVGMSSHILPFLADRIFFRCFRMFCFVCIAWSFLGIFFVFLLWRVPFDLSLRVVLLLLLLLLLLYSFENFSHQRKLMVSFRSLSDRRSSQVSRTLTALNNAVISMVSTSPLISKSSSHCTNLLVTIPSVPVTTDITVTFMYHIFFKLCSKVWVLIFLFAFLQLYPVVSRNGKVRYLARSLFLFVVYHNIRWPVCISNSQRIFYFSFSMPDSGLCIYHLFVWSNLNFLHNS